MTSPAVLRDQIQSVLGVRYAAAFQRNKLPEENLPSVVGDIPRGALTEISGPASSGRTSLMYSLLAAACSSSEFCALLDADGAFDPKSAAMAGVRLSQVLWTRCGGNVEHALKAADMLAQGGGFGLIVIDLGNSPEKLVRRIPLPAWFRLRHAVENTRAALVVLAQKIHTYSCAALKIELSPGRGLWKGQLPGCLLDGFEATAWTIRNHHTQERRFRIEP